MILSRPLRKLVCLRLRGGFRRQLARLRTPRGVLLALLGIALFGFWLASAAFSARTDAAFDPRGTASRVSLVALAFVLVSFSGALRHRGLFIPREEIERLLSAPLSRAEIVRYRLCTNALRSLFGGVFVAVLGASRMPNAFFGFCGALIAMVTLTVFNQFAAIALGALERGSARRLATLSRLLSVLGVAGIVIALGALFTGTGLEEFPVIGPFFSGLDEPGASLHRVTMVFKPWTSAIVATSTPEFLGWILLDLVFLAALFEATARLPVDYRELSLDTAASVAARLRRVRHGGGAAASRASLSSVVRRVPWLFGRGALGAVAWRKTASILRKARSAIAVAILVLLLVVVLARAITNREPGAYYGPMLVALLGTIYLSAGLRFDFREELERMEAIKAWPLAAHKIFVGMLLPQAVLVAALLGAAVALEALAAGELHPITIGCLALLLPVVFGWIALDNAVFLFAPVRAVPGQEGMLQNAGRMVVLMLLRLALLLVAIAVGFGAFFLADLVVRQFFAGSRAVAAAIGLTAAWCAVVLEDVGLAWLGGACLRRFDVARDRG